MKTAGTRAAGRELIRTVKIRDVISGFYCSSDDKREIIPQGSAYALLKTVRPIDGIEPRGSSSAMRSTPLPGKNSVGRPILSPFRIHHLPDEIIEGIQIDAAQGHPAEQWT